MKYFNHFQKSLDQDMWVVPKVSFPFFPTRHLTVRMLWKLGKYSVWECGNNEFLVGSCAPSNEEISMRNMELPIMCVSARVPRAVIQFLSVLPDCLLKNPFFWKMKIRTKSAHRTQKSVQIVYLSWFLALLQSFPIV